MTLKIATTLDCGEIPPKNYFGTKMKISGTDIDTGIIPPKNYFRSKMTISGATITDAGMAILTYQIL
jgi:hypothetical protein